MSTVTESAGNDQCQLSEVLSNAQFAGHLKYKFKFLILP